MASVQLEEYRFLSVHEQVLFVFTIIECYQYYHLMILKRCKFLYKILYIGLIGVLYYESFNLIFNHTYTISFSNNMLLSSNLCKDFRELIKFHAETATHRLINLRYK